jgi:hypothetical protein
MKFSGSMIPTVIRRAALAMAVFGMQLSWHAEAGSWVPVSTSVAFFPPGAFPGHMLLLSDGSVMVQNIQANNWYRLTPDSTGGYTNGNWSTLASMHKNRYYYSSDVLTDGRVFIAGGEFGNGASVAEVYDPVANSWTLINPPTSLMNPSAPSPALASGNQAFLDSQSVVLPNGHVLVAPVGPNVDDGTLLYDPYANTWSEGPLTASIYQDESSWVKLPDGSILTIDPNAQTTERYIPSSNSWIPDRSTPVQLWDTANQEIGAFLLQTNGKVICFGGNGNTAIYTPSGSTSLGSWTVGNSIPNGYVMQDAPSAMMFNGKILFVCSTLATHNPFYFFVYDPASKSYTQINSPTGGLSDSNDISDATSMVDLPDGTVLFNDTSTQLYVYVPDGPQAPTGQPTINSIGFDNQGVIQLSGTLFNGISQGSMYGDDAQEDSNFPILRFTDGGGNVTYGRTFNWSSTGVQTGSQIITAEANASDAFFGSPGTYSVQVVANGIASSPVLLTTPSWTWVDFNYGGLFQFGTFDFPYPTLPQGVSAVSSGGTIAINANSQPSTGHVTVPYTISKPMNIISVNGPSTIGQ